MNRTRVFKYLIIGVSTTFVYFTVRFSVNAVIDNAMISVVAAQALAIVYAFFTNKLFVFRDKSHSRTDIISQFIKFVCGRLLTAFLDLAITYLTIERFSAFFISVLSLSTLDYSSSLFQIPYLSMYIGSAERLNEFIFACLIQIIGIVLNYWLSKTFIFKYGKR